LRFFCSRTAVLNTIDQLVVVGVEKPTFSHHALHVILSHLIPIQSESSCTALLEAHGVPLTSRKKAAVGDRVHAMIIRWI